MNAAAVLRASYPAALAALAAVTRDLSLAEDLLHDAVMAALERWPTRGIPDQPVAWLVAVGRNRWRDQLRRAGRFQAYVPALETLARRAPLSPLDQIGRQGFGDDLLRLVFTVCHPALRAGDRIVLALHTVLGLSCAEVGAALLVAPRSMEKRITRARQRLGALETGFSMVRLEDAPDRLPPVLATVHLLFTVGHATADTSVCALSLSLARAVAAMFPNNTESAGLVALVLLHQARLPARRRDGGLVPLPEQDRRLWKDAEQQEASALLAQASSGASLGPYRIEALIAETHMRPGPTDWARIATLYAALEVCRPTPVVRLNRALAVGKAWGGEAGLAALEPVLSDRAVQRYPYLHLVYGELLLSEGRAGDAAVAFQQALDCARDPKEAELIAAKLQALSPTTDA